MAFIYCTREKGKRIANESIIPHYVKQILKPGAVIEKKYAERYIHQNEVSFGLMERNRVLAPRPGKT